MVDHLEPVGRVDGLPLLDADHHVLRLGVLGVHVVQVVGDDERDLRAARDLADAFTLPLLLGDPVVHELEEVVARAEDLLVLVRDLHRGVDALFQQRAREFALQAGRQRDEALRMRPQELLVHPGAVVVALEMRRGHELHEVLVTGEVLRQEHQVERLAVPLDARVAVVPAVARDVGLDADDRLDARLACGDVKVDRAVQGAVIGERQRRHLQLFRARHEIAHAREPVEQAVLAVRVEVDELRDERPLHRPLVEADAATFSLTGGLLLQRCLQLA